MTKYRDVLQTLRERERLRRTDSNTCRQVEQPLFRLPLHSGFIGNFEFPNPFKNTRPMGHMANRSFEFPSPMDALCQVWLKMAHKFLRGEEDLKFCQCIFAFISPWKRVWPFI